MMLARGALTRATVMLAWRASTCLMMDISPRKIDFPSLSCTSVTPATLATTNGANISSDHCAAWETVSQNLLLFTSDKGGGKCYCPCLFVGLSVCLSVCLLARLLKNACMDLDEMLRVDRCRDMDELLTFESNPDYSPDTGTGLLSAISYKRCYTEFYVGKIGCIRIGGPPLQRGVGFKMVLHHAAAATRDFIY